MRSPRGLVPGESMGAARRTPKPTMKVHHAHGCTQCSRRYTDTCSTPHVNGTCRPCAEPEMNIRRPLWVVHHDPEDCCRTDCRVATFREREVYALGGPGPWWRCTTCSRTHPYDPTESP